MAVSMFWAAIDARDQVNSALKDMAVVMSLSDEAIEVINLFVISALMILRSLLTMFLSNLTKGMGKLQKRRNATVQIEKDRRRYCFWI
ncbi:hypothetical protein Pint_25982 [Pistacia integerrima]|uniref:Uncharacterized protein n=1 Tax=Pistacia integerrima TaxID=434235 RepID=A0ACC0YAE4_9ROSI|nr:hypothetical protein Pint_25982 [Pistacia integerrima]